MNDHLKNGSRFPSCIHSLYQRITRIRLPYTSEDRMIAPDNQKRMSTRGARKVITLATSHASLASKPIEVRRELCTRSCCAVVASAARIDPPRPPTELCLRCRSDTEVLMKAFAHPQSDPEIQDFREFGILPRSRAF